MTRTQPAPEALTESKRQQLAISQTITLIRTENKKKTVYRNRSVFTQNETATETRAFLQKCEQMLYDSDRMRSQSAKRKQ